MEEARMWFDQITTELLRGMSYSMKQFLDSKDLVDLHADDFQEIG